MNNLILTVAEYLLLILFCSLSTAIAAFALFLLHKLNKNRNFNAAPSLIVFLSSLGVCCVTLTVQYTLFFLSTIFNTYLYSLVSPTQFIFWVGLVPSSLIPAAPICVFFLSLDRLLIILKPILYNSCQSIKQMVAAFSLISVISLFTMHLVFNLSDRPSTERPECISFGCLTSDDSRQFYALNRLAVALPNFLAGTAFLAALFSFRRRLERISGGSNNKGVPTNSNLTPTNTAEINNTDSRKMSDHLVFYCVLFELVLDLLPNFVYFLLTTFDVNVSVYVGAFRSMSYALCAFCSVFAHTAILWNIFKSAKIPPTLVRPMV
uniref:G-protein coupled receptors family 1 profile domain-containing protein n=1 Tax=Globodera rostochiensis TaxID=31243 RepID=A0A914GPR1_GLORO